MAYLVPKGITDEMSSAQHDSTFQVYVLTVLALFALVTRSWARAAAALRNGRTLFAGEFDQLGAWCLGPGALGCCSFVVSVVAWENPVRR